MKRIDTVIIGAGQAGLAASRCLTSYGVDHVILERGRVASRWEQRWDSLRLLSPNWMTRLPGWTYRGPDPEGYMGRQDVVAFLEAYARSFDAPVHARTEVLRAEPATSGWQVTTTGGSWLAGHVVVATGHCQHTRIPAAGQHVPADIVQQTAAGYRRPEQLPPGGVLVVGASATGVQLADELARSGRQVVLAVGRHTRLPRRYRGKDVLYWLDRIGALTRPLTELSRPDEGRREPSMQLTGSEPPRTLDLAVLAQQGIRLTGHLQGFDDRQALFAGDLAATTGEADMRLRRLLARIDSLIAAEGLERALPAADRIVPVRADHAPLALNLRAEGIRSVLWATGYSRSYPWLRAPVLDDRGEIRQVRGRTPAPGLYVLGLQFLTRRNSSFIDGVGCDAFDIAKDIARRTGRRKEAA